MKRALALVLGIIMIFSIVSLCGCKKEEEEATIVGKWEATINLADCLNDAMGAEGMEEYFDFSSFKVKFIMEFDDDGNYEMTADEASVKKALVDVKKDMVKGMEKLLADTLKEQNIDMTVEEYLALLDTDMETLVDEAFTDDAVDEAIGDYVTKGKYVAEDGKQFTTTDEDEEVDTEDGDYEKYELDGDKLILKEYVGDNEDAALVAGVYPVTFKRVK